MKSIVVTGTLIEQLSNLARLGVNRQITPRLVTDMGEVLGYVDRIQKVSTKDFTREAEKAICRKDSQSHSAWFVVETVGANIPRQKDGAIYVEETFVTGNVKE